MTEASNDEVWYAAYGSNLDPARFSLYVLGGTNVDTRRPTPGCRDHRPPSDSVRDGLDHDVVFARESSGWRGAVAFLDCDRPGRAHVRLWRVLAEQMVDVVAQENGKAPGTIEVDVLDGLGADDPQRTVLRRGWYARVLWCGERDGLPILTCTAAGDIRAEPAAPPSSAYLGTIARGLRDMGLSGPDVVAYLGGRPGVAGVWDPGSLAALVDASVQ